MIFFSSDFIHPGFRFHREWFKKSFIVRYDKAQPCLGCRRELRVAVKRDPVPSKTGGCF